jgi:uncharacterized protein YutE (UPF0331/DUF86 family)
VTDPELIGKKLALIETAVTQLRTLARLDRLADDVREQRFIEHTLQIAIQAALDVASHLVSDLRLGEPETNRALFTMLATHGWLTAEDAQNLSAMAGFRNVLVHGYTDVDFDILRNVVEHHLNDLLRFVQVVRERL